MLQLLTRASVAHFDERQVMESERPRFRLLRSMMVEGVGAFVQNVQGELYVVVHDGVVYPISVQGEGEESYVNSLWNQYVNYAKEETRIIERTLWRRVANVGIDGIGLLLRALRIDWCVYWDNLFVSTNLHRPMTSDIITAITELLETTFPHRTIVYRSVLEKDGTQHAASWSS
ncbi:MAG: hypothetical protein ACRC5C_03485, partial [Bacilli bacterium]